MVAGSVGLAFGGMLDELLVVVDVVVAAAAVVVVVVVVVADYGYSAAADPEVIPAEDACSPLRFGPGRLCWRAADVAVGAFVPEVVV